MMRNVTEVVLARAETLLSPAQRRAALEGGNRLITACPGAGKTRSIAARAALLASRQEPFALTTYTNVAAREMVGTVERDFHTQLEDRQFVGTLHGLLLRFVFRPFGHLVMECSTQPSVRVTRMSEMIDVQGWELNPDDFSFTPQGTFIFRGPQPEKYVKKADVAHIAHESVLASKAEQARSGVVTSDDAMYWSLRVLRENEDARRSMAARFGELIVDEAQDTSALQIACLEQIAGAEDSPSLVLVGDFDQSIYSFQGASPRASHVLAEAAGLESVRLAENYRSSQLICNVSALLRHVKEPDRAKGPNADVALQPSVVLYDPSRVSDVPQRFADSLGELGLRLEDSAVIARGNKLVGQLSGAPSRRLRRSSPLLNLLELTSARESAIDRSKIALLEELLLELSNLTTGSDDAFVSSEQLRSATMSVIEALPHRQVTLGEWHETSMGAINEAARSLNPTGASEASPHFPLGAEMQGEPLSDFLPKVRSDGLLVTTVHGVKGRSLDGVLLVADYEEDWRGREPENWGEFFRASLRGETTHLRSEELRILYVGVTRAERMCQVALPEDVRPEALDAFRDAGFHTP